MLHVAHSVWFWLLVAIPCLSWPVLWIVANTAKVSFKPLKPWLLAVLVLSAVPYLLFESIGSHKVLHLVSGSIFFTCMLMLNLIQQRSMFETLRPPGTRWCFPWKAAQFSIPHSMRILVRDIDSVTPWYAEKLGLRKLTENPHGETGIATLRFKEDGNSVVLTTRSGFQTNKTPILFTKRIGKVRDVMTARGVKVGTIEKDRQGIRYFQIHDPEGNEIEVVEDR